MSVRALSLVLMLATGQIHAASCSLSTTPVSFGDYNPLTVLPRDASGTLTVSCTSGLLEIVNLNIALSAGASGNSSARHMTQAAKTLNYNLYQDITRLVLWGSGANSQSSNLNITTILLPFNVNFTVYGRIPAQQNVAGGSYSDTITATLTF